MAVVAVSPHCDGARDSGSVDSKIPQWRTGLDDISRIWARRCASPCTRRDLTLKTATSLEIFEQRLIGTNVNGWELYAAATACPEATILSHIEPPPSYYDSFADQPPSYDPAEDTATVKPYHDQQRLPPVYEYLPPKKHNSTSASMTTPYIDFSDTSTFRQVGNKKAKKAQQQANKDKWADGGDEGNKDEGEAGEDGGGGGGSNNGDGGAGDGGGGGDDWTNWDTGNKKKKGKKAKEEDKQKQEEEEEEERKQQEEAAANATNPLSWADDANGDLGDDWGGFTTANKKEKKGKKGKTDLIPETPNGISNFDDINLNDDAPKLDLDFDSTGKKDTGFGFGTWGGTGKSTWDTGNTWSFGNEAATTDIAESFSKASTANTGDDGSWSFGGNKKNQKKTTTTATNGFDFGDFGALEEEKEEEPKAEDTQAGIGDDWGTSFTATGKKGKKDKKKSVFGERTIEPDLSTIGTAVVDPETVADASWGTGWGATATKSKKKGKKGEDEAPPPPPPAPAPPTEPAAADDWGGFGNKKDKKKGKKIVELEEPVVTVVPDPEPEADAGWGAFGKKDKKKNGKKEPEKAGEPAIDPVLDPEPEADVGWGSFAKKDKKKNGKKEPEKSEEPLDTIAPEPDGDLDFGWGGAKKEKKKGKKDDKVDEPAITLVPEPEPEADSGWGLFGKKDKKKGAKKDAEKVDEPLISKDSDPEPKADGWSSFGAKKEKKKRSLWDEPEKEDEDPIIEETIEPDTTADPGWGVFGSKKDKAKKGKKDPFEAIPPPPPEPEPIVEEKPALSRTGSKKEKKGKKGLASEVKDDPVVISDSKTATEAATNVAADDDSMSGWGGSDKKKDKKSKRNSLASSKGDDDPPPPPPVPAVPEVPDTSSFDIWGSSSKKEKDKKGKKGKTMEPEAEITTVDDPVETKDDPAEENWAASTWGLSAKDKKKKEKERDKAKKEKEEKDKQEKEEQEREEEEQRLAKEKEEEEKAARAKEKSTVKGKAGKKGKAGTSPEVSKTKDLLADSVPDIAPAVEEDTWGSWGGSKQDKKKGSKKAMDFEDPPPPAPTPPAQGLTPEPEEEADEWASFAPVKTAKGKKDTKKDTKADEMKAGKKSAKDKIEEVVEEEQPAKVDLKKKALTKDETPAKAAKSFWGGVGSTSTSKSKSSKADEKATKDAKIEAESEVELDPDEIVEILEEPVKKSSKDKSGTKLSKTGTKESDKANKLSDGKKSVTDDVPMAKGKDGKFKGLDKDVEEKEDAFLSSSLWGSSKKTSGKKGDEAKIKIGKEDSANQKGSVKKGAWNEPEATELDDQPSAAQPTKASRAAMSSTKPSKPSSVQQRVKELEKYKASEPEPIAPPPPPVDPEPTPKADKKGALGKTKNSSSSKSAALKPKNPSPIDEKQPLKDSVPGSFPGEFEGMDDEFAELMDSPPIEKKESKESKKNSKSAKEPKLPSKTRETPESKRPPTPPPEPKEEKPVKKERARVVKAGGASSWGMWGAAASAKDKKESKSKDDADISSPPPKVKAPAPGLSRSKSTRMAKEKDKEAAKSDSKSSDSDKPKKTESRPPKSRGSSFGALFGGAPTRTKSVRRSSTATSVPKNSSGRQSTDVDATGLPSPPVEEASGVGGKAAKLMGVSGGKLDRKASSKAKQKVSAAPDPYAIDSDDMVMVNGLDDPIINAPIPKKGKDKGSKPKFREVEPDAPSNTDFPDRTRSKRGAKTESGKSKRQSKAFNDDDDIVMVDAGPSDGPEVADGPDDMQFITKPKGLQRSSTSPKKPESKMGGLFGAFRKKPVTDIGERPKSKGMVEDEAAPRKRTVTGGNDSAKRPRRDDRKRSDKATSRAAEGYVYDTAADAAGATEAEDADARKEERRARRVDKDLVAKDAREEALRYEAERRTKRKAAEKEKARDEKDRKVRKTEEAEARAQEEKDARRAARRAKEEEQANRELEEDILKPRSKRHDTDKDPEKSSRPSKHDRRRSQYDKPIAPQAPDEEETRRIRRDERRAKADRRKSAVPVNDYFDPRNAKPNNDPYGGGGNDHTASWVESLAKESPEPPPVEPTIMEPAPDLRATGADDLQAEEDMRRSSHRKSKRSSRMYTDPMADDQDDRRRRRESKREGVRNGEGSAEEERFRSPGRQSELGGVKLGGGAKTFDGKTGQGKRSSWFQKIGGRL